MRTVNAGMLPGRSSKPSPVKPSCDAAHSEVGRAKSCLQCLTVSRVKGGAKPSNPLRPAVESGHCVLAKQPRVHSPEPAGRDLNFWICSMLFRFSRRTESQSSGRHFDRQVPQGQSRQSRPVICKADSHRKRQAAATALLGLWLCFVTCSHDCFGYLNTVSLTIGGC